MDIATQFGIWAESANVNPGNRSFNRNIFRGWSSDNVCICIIKFEYKQSLAAPMFKIADGPCVGNVMAWIPNTIIVPRFDLIGRVCSLGGGVPKNNATFGTPPLLHNPACSSCMATICNLQITKFSKSRNQQWLLDSVSESVFSWVGSDKTRCKPTRILTNRNVEYCLSRETGVSKEFHRSGICMHENASSICAALMHSD